MLLGAVESFQTNPCGVEAPEIWLFGGLLLEAFQTNPCGVEAVTVTVSSTTTVCFRRTLVGLKRPMSFPTVGLWTCFRRTLVGLKLRYELG